MKRVMINSELRRNGNETITMCFMDPSTNFIGTTEENHENFHQVD
jgi:hypothetical protein